MYDAPPRITGTEMEWSIVTSPGDYNQFSQYISGEDIEKVLKAYYDSVPSIGSGTSKYLGNGARLYKDFGDHIEYATPEDISFTGTLANEIASERIVLGALEVIQKRGRFKKFALNRRVIDDQANTWGYHESYGAEAGSISIDPKCLALLGIHLATRNIFVGAGYLDCRGSFRVAQKAGKLNADFHLGTTHLSKPVVNLRDEPLADKNEWVRIHVTSGDPNMSPWATRMKLGTTSLVIRLIEHGYTLKNLLGTDLNRMCKLVAADTTLKQTLDILDGKPLAALQIQKLLMEKANHLAKVIKLPEEEQWTLEEWEKACAEAEKDPMLLGNRTDWVAKLRLLERYRQKKGLPWDSPLLRSKDRQWDSIGEDGIGKKMRKKVWSEWMPSEELIVSRMTNPPDSTRAHIRGTFIQQLHTSKLAGTEWASVRVGDKTIELGNPYVKEDISVNQLIDETLKKTESKVKVSSG